MNISDCDGRELNVRFYSRKVKNSVGKVVRETTCKLAIVDESKTGRERYDNVAVGTALQNSKDRDNKAVGQKKAFANAILSFPKDDRIHLWQQFDEKAFVPVPAAV